MLSSVKTIIDQFKALPADQQFDVAKTIDRLTWSKRWAEICARIAATKRNLTEEQIDAMVQATRREKPFSERSSTYPY